MEKSVEVGSHLKMPYTVSFSILISYFIIQYNHLSFTLKHLKYFLPVLELDTKLSLIHKPTGSSKISKF